MIHCTFLINFNIKATINTGGFIVSKQHYGLNVPLIISISKKGDQTNLATFHL